jgi:peptidoglycan/LPS O-acetylase OafA/YrhL
MHQAEANSERVFGLDIFRAAAILLVLLLHSRFILDGTFLEGFPFVRIIDGVELFFVLSGFLIGGILLRRINSSEGFRVGDLLRFWKRRWFRTLPGYYLILAVNYVVVRYNVIHEGIYNFNWKYFFFLQNFSKPMIGFYRESWSLTVEEWFYIITPLMLFVLIRVTQPKFAFLVSVLFMLAFSFTCRASMMDVSLDRFWVDLTFRKVVIMRLDSIGHGLLAAWVFYYYRAYWDRYRWPAFIAGAAVMVFILSYRAAAGTFYSQVIYFSLSAVASMLLLPVASNVKTGNGIIARGITHISLVSYSMYLINFSLVAEVIRDQFAPHGGVDGLVKYAAYWAIVIVGATGLYYGFEKPVMDLRERV